MRLGIWSEFYVVELENNEVFVMFLGLFSVFVLLFAKN